MSLSAIQTAVQTQIQSVTNFGTANVAIGSYHQLNSGVKRAVVIVFQEHEHQNIDFADVQNIWRFQIHLFEKMDPDPQAAFTAFATDYDAIVTRFDQWPVLGATAGVLSAIITGGNDTGELVEMGGQQYLAWLMLLEIEERVAVTRQE